MRMMNPRHPKTPMMNNFTPRAQQVLALARKEADRFNHNYVGTEHLLLGLIKLGQGVAVNVLTKLGVDLDTVRMQVEQQVGSGPDTKMVGNIPYTPRVKKVLALASKEAKALPPASSSRSRSTSSAHVMKSSANSTRSSPAASPARAVRKPPPARRSAPPPSPRIKRK